MDELARGGRARRRRPRLAAGPGRSPRGSTPARPGPGPSGGAAGSGIAATAPPGWPRSPRRRRCWSDGPGPRPTGPRWPRPSAVLPVGKTHRGQAKNTRPAASPAAIGWRPRRSGCRRCRSAAAARTSVEITAVGRSKTRRHSHQFSASASQAAGQRHDPQQDNRRPETGLAASSSRAKKKGLSGLPAGVLTSHGPPWRMFQAVTPYQASSPLSPGDIAQAMAAEPEGQPGPARRDWRPRPTAAGRRRGFRVAVRGPTQRDQGFGDFGI